MMMCCLYCKHIVGMLMNLLVNSNSSLTVSVNTEHDVIKSVKIPSHIVPHSNSNISLLLLVDSNRSTAICQLQRPNFLPRRLLLHLEAILVVECHVAPVQVVREGARQQQVLLHQMHRVGDANEQ